MTESGNISREALIEGIRKLAPWHQNLRLTDDVEILDAFDEQERKRENNENVSLLTMESRFLYKTGLLYPEGLNGKTFLDCACNGGAYCFWARQMGAERAFGFDVRQHWIDQANFVQQHRTIEPTDNTRFQVCDLMNLPELRLEQADLTLFKGIFYHLADPIQGLKIAADLTREIIVVNTARMYTDNTESLYCVFEKPSKLMSGVHALSWIPTGPSVIAKILYWLGFQDIRHVFSNRYEQRPGYGRMELVAAREPGRLDHFAESKADDVETIDVAKHANSAQASEIMRGLF